MVEAWRSGGVALLDSTGLARVFITSLLLFAIAICLINMLSQLINQGRLEAALAAKTGP